MNPKNASLSQGYSSGIMFNISGQLSQAAIKIIYLWKDVWDVHLSYFFSIVKAYQKQIYLREVEIKIVRVREQEKKQKMG